MTYLLSGRVRPVEPDQELRVDCRVEGRAGAAYVTVGSKRVWCGAAGDLVWSEGRLSDWASEEDLAQLAGQALRQPPWPWRVGDGGMMAGAVVQPGSGVEADGGVGEIECLLFADPLGAVPLYYAEVDGTLYFGTRLLDLEIPERRIDPVGVLEAQGLDHCVGDRTLLEGVRCLAPSRTLRWTPSTGARLLEWGSPLWQQRRLGSVAALSSEMASALAGAADRTAASIGERRSGLMLGGLDSRLVLQLLDDRGRRPGISCTYGRKGVGETDTAVDVARAYGMEHVVQTLGLEDVGDGPLWRRLLSEAGIMAHPHWDRAARLLVEGGAECALAGSLGDVVLGGSYYKYPPRTRGRLMLGLDWGTSRATTATRIEEAVAQQMAILRTSGWHVPLKECAAQSVGPLWQQVEDDLRTTLSGYAEQGMDDWSQLTERFALDHRGRWMILGQERTLARHLPLLTPLLDTEVLQFGYNLAPAKRAERRIISHLVRTRYRRLASFKVPNSLVPHSAPPVLIAAGKLMRRKLAARNTRRYVERGGQGTFSGGGWPSAWDPLLRSEPVLRRIREFLNHELFDQERIDRYFGNLRRGGGWVGTGRSLLRFIELQALFEAVGTDGLEP